MAIFEIRYDSEDHRPDHVNAVTFGMSVEDDHYEFNDADGGTVAVIPARNVLSIVQRGA